MPDLSALNTLDSIVLGLMVWSIGWAAWRGFSQEIFSLIGLAVAIFIAFNLGEILDGPMAGMIPDQGIARMISRALILLGVLILLNIVTRAGARALRDMLSRVVDHSLGLLFGFIRGALIVCVPYLFVNLYIDPSIYPKFLTEAQSFRFLEGGANILRATLPASQIRDDERSDLKSLDQAVEEQTNIQGALDGMNGKSNDEKTDKNNENEKESSGNFSLKELTQGLKEAIQF